MLTQLGWIIMIMFYDGKLLQGIQHLTSILKSYMCKTFRLRRNLSVKDRNEKIVGEKNMPAIFNEDRNL